MVSSLQLKKARIHCFLHVLSGIWSFPFWSRDYELIAFNFRNWSAFMCIFTQETRVYVHFESTWRQHDSDLLVIDTGKQMTWKYRRQMLIQRNTENNVRTNVKHFRVNRDTKVVGIYFLDRLNKIYSNSCHLKASLPDTILVVSMLSPQHDSGFPRNISLLVEKRVSGYAGNELRVHTTWPDSVTPALAVTRWRRVRN